MKNIAVFINDLRVGGIQKSVTNILKNIDYTKYSVDLYMFGDNCFYEIPEKTNVIYLKKPHRVFQFLPFNIVKKIMKVDVLNKKYDVAIDFDSYQMHTALGALKCDALKKAIWIHNDIPIKLKEEPKYRILHFFFKKKYRYFDTFCAVSKGAMDAFKKLENCKGKKCYVVPNYIDTNEIKNKMNEDVDLKINKKLLNIVTVGRLCHQKGIDIMLNNISELTNYRNDFHLYIIGDGEERVNLEKQAHSLNIEKYVTFVGNQKNPFKYLKQMNLFYLSSRYEGQGMVILEAMAVGLDILIPKHLEKYCPKVKGTNDIIGYLKKYQKNGRKKFNSLQEYNENITNELEKIFNN